MDKISGWAAVLCICAAICAIADTVSPGGRTDKVLKVVLSGFLMCALIAPLKNIDFSLNFDLPLIETEQEESEHQVLFNEQTRKLAQHKIVMLVQQELDKISVAAKKIEAFMDNEDVTSISIITIEVTITEEYAPYTQKIKSVIENELGLNATVNVERN